MSHAIAAARAVQVLRASGTSVDFEPVLTNCYSRLISPNDTVLDAGAHAGRHLKQFLNLVGATGKVVAVEPLPFMFNHLRDTYGADPRVELHNMALSNFDGEAEFTIVQNAPEESGLREKIYNVASVQLEKTPVLVRRMDTAFAGRKFDFIKIDVEGAEIDMLSGGQSVLREARPFITVEYGYPSYSSYGNTKETLFNAAEGLGYRCCDLYGNVVSSIGDWLKVCDWAYWDYLLVPIEKEAEFQAKYDYNQP